MLERDKLGLREKLELRENPELRDKPDDPMLRPIAELMPRRCACASGVEKLAASSKARETELMRFKVDIPCAPLG
jgi:hypothetical protein